MIFPQIKKMRNKKNIPQKAIASMIGISQPAYSRYETGDEDFPLYVIIFLADYYQVSIDFLLGRKKG